MESWTSATEPDLAARRDDELLALVRDGRSAAFAELWRRHASAGRAMAAHLVWGMEPDDAVSEAYTRILAATARGDGPRDNFRGYLRATIRNLAVSHLRGNLETPQSNIDELVAHAPDPSGVVELRVTFDEAWSRLRSPAQRLLHRLAHDGVSAGDIAIEEGVPVEAIHARAYRARTRLRAAWDSLCSESVG